MSHELLCESIGHKDVTHFETHHAYHLRDKLKGKSVKKSGEKYANRNMTLLKHVFTKAIEWGIINDHPMTESKFKMVPKAKSKFRVPTLKEVKKAAGIANPMLKLYISLRPISHPAQSDFF
jgi:hypothetical protein